jgi:hypothetical protein
MDFYLGQNWNAPALSTVPGFVYISPNSENGEIRPHDRQGLHIFGAAWQTVLSPRLQLLFLQVPGTYGCPDNDYHAIGGRFSAARIKQCLISIPRCYAIIDRRSYRKLDHFILFYLEWGRGIELFLAKRKKKGKRRTYHNVFQPTLSRLQGIPQRERQASTNFNDIVL